MSEKIKHMTDKQASFYRYLTMEKYRQGLIDEKTMKQNMSDSYLNEKFTVEEASKMIEESLEMTGIEYRPKKSQINIKMYRTFDKGESSNFIKNYIDLKSHTDSKPEEYEFDWEDAFDILNKYNG